MKPVVLGCVEPPHDAVPVRRSRDVDPRKGPEGWIGEAPGVGAKPPGGFVRRTATPVPTSWIAGMPRSGRLIALALHSLAQRPPLAPHRFRLFAHAALRRLLIAASALHLAERALALHLLLQDAKGLVHVVVAYEYLHLGSFSLA